MALKSHINTYSLFKSTAACALLAMCAAQVQAQEFARIGFVDNERIMREANPARQAVTRMEQEFAARGKELEQMGARLKATSEKFDRDAPTMSDADRSRRQAELVELDRTFQRRQREFREDAAQRSNEERTLFLSKANRVIKQIADAEKFDIIFQEAVYFNPRIDITDKVLKVLNK
jgi:outer membrane protein